MSSVETQPSRSLLFPDVSNPHKERKTSRIIPEKTSDEEKVFPEHNITQFRKPLHHTICTGLLCAGFHRSFAQVFALLQRWEKAETHAHKLEQLQCLLSTAEAAERAGQYVEVYDNHLCLARFFTEPEDEWLRDHFFQVALQSARKIKIDSGKREAEANLHVGQVYEEKGQLELAQEHFQVFYHMTLGREWQDTSGRPHHSRSCEELGKVYTLLAERLLQTQDYEPAIKMLTKAYEMATEAGDPGSKGKAAYRLGLAYQSLGDHTTAKQFLGVYKEISTALDDLDNVGRAYEAIAKSLESEGKQTEAVQCLEKFAEISMTNKQDGNLEKAYMYLGSIFNSRMQYDESHEYFKHVYEIACNMASVSRLQNAQVHVGTSRALSMLQTYNKHIEMSEQRGIQNIVTWKDNRQDFTEPIEQQ